MKHYKKYLDVKHWLAFLRRQPKHMQHVYAVIFSAVITSLIASAILYYDYGFWHEKYSRTDSLVVQVKPEEIIKTQSPGELIGSFLKEAKEKVNALQTGSSNILQNKEVYTKDATSTESNTTGE
jgi:hypothetical protein